MDIAATAGYERRIAIATKRQQDGAEGLPDQGASRRAAMQLTRRARAWNSFRRRLVLSGLRIPKEAPGTTSHSL
eukprot:6477811-Pyramimonas_sp.AAC.1